MATQGIENTLRFVNSFSLPVRRGASENFPAKN